MVRRYITWFGEDILIDLVSCILSSLGSFLRGSQTLELTPRDLPLYNSQMKLHLKQERVEGFG